MLLDVYGTNHDPGLWPDPDAFDPSRFVGVEPDRLAFMPHGEATRRPGTAAPANG